MHYAKSLWEEKRTQVGARLDSNGLKILRQEKKAEAQSSAWTTEKYWCQAQKMLHWEPGGRGAGLTSESKKLCKLRKVT